MAIVDARVLRSLELTEAATKQSTKLTASQDILVVSDTANPLFSDILADTNTYTNLGGVALPQLGDVVTVNGIVLTVSSRKLSWYKRDNERTVLMSVAYEGYDPESSGDPPNGSSEPTWRRITVRTQQQTRPASGWQSLEGAVAGDKALDRPPTNSAGDPVEGIEEDGALVALTYTNPNVSTPNFTNLNSYTNTCNSVDFLGGTVYTVRCLGYSADFDEGKQTWNVSVEFLYNPKDWSILFYDVGFHELVGNERRAILDSRGNPVNEPVPLDGAGGAISAASLASYVPDFSGFLNHRYIYPYPARDLNQIWTDCNI